MKRTDPKGCPCQSNVAFDDCCQPLILGTKIATTPEQLMRSRYTAYSRKNVMYLMKTWDASTRPLLEKFESGQWIHLEILNTVIDNVDAALEANGKVEFIAKHIHKTTLTILHEVSSFHQQNRVWLYLNGSIKEGSNSSHKIEMKAPCPCSSGRRFKDCHFKK